MCFLLSGSMSEWWDSVKCWNCNVYGMYFLFCSLVASAGNNWAEYMFHKYANCNLRHNNSVIGRRGSSLIIVINLQIDRPRIRGLTPWREIVIYLVHHICTCSEAHAVSYAIGTELFHGVKAAEVWSWQLFFFSVALQPNFGPWSPPWNFPFHFDY
jgi:hypothetical protein